MVIFIILLAVFLPMPAHAYIDPGSGHLLIQLILGVGIGLAFHLKRLVSFFRGVKTAKAPEKKSEADESKAVGE